MKHQIIINILVLGPLPAPGGSPGILGIAGYYSAFDLKQIFAVIFLDNEADIIGQFFRRFFLSGKPPQKLIPSVREECIISIRYCRLTIFGRWEM